MKENILSVNLAMVAFFSAMIVMFASGCAQYMAVRQPSPFTPTCLTQGTARTTVIAELEKPITSEEHKQALIDVYQYVDGGDKNHWAWKTTRIVLYTAGDICTLWIDQVVWMPLEKFVFPGTDHAVTAKYVRSEDESWRIKNVDDQALQKASNKKEAF